MTESPRRPIVWSATPTPFLADGSIDQESLHRLVAQHERLGVTGLFLAGSSGEGPFMPDRQRTELVESVRRIAGNRLHLSVQVSDTSAARVTANIRDAVAAGADSIVLAPPSPVLGRCNRNFLRRYFLEPLEGTSVTAGLYLRAGPPGMELDWALWEEVIAHPRVSLVKDSTNDDAVLGGLAAWKSRRPTLTVLTGYEFDVIKAVAAGYDGCLAGTAIFNGGMLGRAMTARLAGNLAEATAWQERSNQLLRDLFRPDLGAWMSGLKAALVQAGIFRITFSHLCDPFDESDERRIAAALTRERAEIGLA